MTDLERHMRLKIGKQHIDYILDKILYIFKFT